VVTGEISVVGLVTRNCKILRSAEAMPLELPTLPKLQAPTTLQGYGTSYKLIFKLIFEYLPKVPAQWRSLQPSQKLKRLGHHSNHGLSSNYAVQRTLWTLR
jgi:hypothetical protein